MTEDPNKPYDPDEPPESSFITEMVGRLTTSILVTPDNLKEVDPRIVEHVSKYWEKGRAGAVWYLEAQGISVLRSDGQPFRMSDIIALTDKHGKWLTKGMAPDAFAAAFRGFKVTASYLQTGQPNSAVGRIFNFKQTEVKLGKTFKKVFSLYPMMMFPVDYTYTGEVTTIEPSTADSGATTAAPKTSEADAIRILRETLVGKTPAQMFDVILENPELKAVGTLFGVGLMEAATDESLAKVLVENKVVSLNAEGVFFVEPA